MSAIVNGEVVAVKGLSHRHEAIVDLMLLHPGKSKGWIAEQLGFTPAWLSTVTRSDAFVEYYNARREQANASKLKEIYDQQVDVARKAYTRLDEYLTGDEVHPQMALNIAVHTSAAIGAGPKRTTIVDEVERELTAPVVDKEILALARERLRRTIISEG